LKLLQTTPKQKVAAEQESGSGSSFHLILLVPKYQVGGDWKLKMPYAAASVALAAGLFTNYSA